jgi:hypothetical protein
MKCVSGLLAALLFALPSSAGAQARGPARPAEAKAAAPIDLTGYWVSLITEEWRWRMVTPPKGDYASIPMTNAAKAAADQWDPAKDEGAGEQCKGYGAAAIMRLPERLHVTWEDNNTLRIDTDTGTQTRLLHFGQPAPATAMPSRQGYSVAKWDFSARRGTTGGELSVTTTKMHPGYLRKNGVPYSGNAVLTEYFNRITEENGDEYLVVTTIVEDPMYLNQTFITSSHFKKLPDATGWNPTPCSAR